MKTETSLIEKEKEKTEFEDKSNKYNENIKKDKYNKENILQNINKFENKILDDKLKENDYEINNKLKESSFHETDEDKSKEIIDKKNIKGNEGLIIKLKANNFFEGKGLRPDDFHKLYEIYSKYYSKITLPEAIRQNFYLCIQYYEYDYNDEVKSFLDENAVFNIYNIIHGDWTREEKLFITFNIIEIEIKIRKKSKKELIELINILEKINCDNNKKKKKSII